MSEARELNRVFVTNMEKHRPFVHVKVAQSLDGRVALNGHSQTWLTGVPARRLVHQWRAEHDAVLVGANTVNADDPRLNVRYGEGRDPAVVILDGNLSLNTRTRVLKSANRRQVLVVTTAGQTHKKRQTIEELKSRGVSLLFFHSRDNLIPMRRLLKELYDRGIHSVMVEGGTKTFTQFVSSGEVDLLSVYVAPMLLGGGVSLMDGRKDAVSWKGLRRARASSGFVGADLLIQFKWYN
jgi:diaminohydroxyphosphoribosylaminopyrimidine deaminase/5-amino-6-(5-phosphoribosylamino)uracil reductase